MEHTVTTPVGRPYDGLAFQGKICGVSIMRAGEAMEQGLRDCCRSVRIGKILIQRDDDTSLPKLLYEKLPDDVASRWVLLLDPMFATGAFVSLSTLGTCMILLVVNKSFSLLGGSAIMAVEVLKARGVPEDRILFLSLIASPQGVANFSEKFPKTRVVTAFIDEGLDSKKHDPAPLSVLRALFLDLSDIFGLTTVALPVTLCLVWATLETGFTQCDC